MRIVLFRQQVIFSQTSELLERQSSMASSTEEVSASGQNDLSNESRRSRGGDVHTVDTTDTEQRFGVYMREFDFLEYELESLEGESVDNFNWGVRRPSLSHLDNSQGGSGMNIPAAAAGGEFGMMGEYPHHHHRGGHSQSSSISSSVASADQLLPTSNSNILIPQPLSPVSDLTLLFLSYIRQHNSICLQDKKSKTKKEETATTTSEETTPELTKKTRESHHHHHHQRRKKRRAVVTESSDDEFSASSSQKSGDENSSSVSTASENLDLPLDKLGKRRYESLVSDTDEDDDDDDITDDEHDLTPCNQSPSLNLNWMESSGGGGAFGAAGFDSLSLQQQQQMSGEMEEAWKRLVHSVMQNATNESLLETFVVFGKLFSELKTKTCVLSQDASATLSKDKSPLSQETMKSAADHFQTLHDILSSISFLSYVWCEFENIGGSRLIERVKFIILELQENLDNYSDKKELTLECLDAVKAHQKLVNLGEQLLESDYNIDTEQVDLCRCLYKLHFQLLILLESFAKLLRLIKQSSAKIVEDGEVLSDRSEEIKEIADNLLRVAPESDLVVQSLERDLKEAQKALELVAREINKEEAEEEDGLNSSAESHHQPQEPTTALDDDDDRSNTSSTPTIVVDEPDEDHPEEGNKEVEEIEVRSLNSSEISAVETIRFEAQTRRESEYHVYGLVCEKKWTSAMAYFARQHQSRWGNVNNAASTAEENVLAVLGIFCAIHAEKGESKFFSPFCQLPT